MVARSLLFLATFLVGLLLGWGIAQIHKDDSDEIWSWDSYLKDEKMLYYFKTGIYQKPVGSVEDNPFA